MSISEWVSSFKSISFLLFKYIILGIVFWISRLLLSPIFNHNNSAPAQYNSFNSTFLLTSKPEIAVSPQLKNSNFKFLLTSRLLIFVAPHHNFFKLGQKLTSNCPKFDHSQLKISKSGLFPNFSSWSSWKVPSGALKPAQYNSFNSKFFVKSNVLISIALQFNFCKYGKHSIPSKLLISVPWTWISITFWISFSDNTLSLSLSNVFTYSLNTSSGKCSSSIGTLSTFCWLSSTTCPSSPCVSSITSWTTSGTFPSSACTETGTHEKTAVTPTINEETAATTFLPCINFYPS